MSRSWRVLIQIINLFCSTVCLEKMKINNCQKNLSDSAWSETENHVNLF